MENNINWMEVEELENRKNIQQFLSRLLAFQDTMRRRDIVQKEIYHFVFFRESNNVKQMERQRMKVRSILRSRGFFKNYLNFCVFF